ncbi:uncharacterized protein LOC123542972 [Mercenaria mercenaria]|uniref:uncharacterized protein LOC123542972 n=1 Tax=Mercenaria mercenaria TaxID=6596 RepID=UPI00234E5D4E|nr:uncharacterized protein LOC123542972 [Mercenaria mercenaria]
MFYIPGKSDVLQRHKQHLKNDLSRNWVRGGLGVKYFKVGLESLLDPLVVEQHKKILKKAQDESKFKQCQECKNKTFIPHEKSQCKRSEREKKKCPCANPNGRLCPSGRFCGIIYDQIASDHQCSEPNLKNTRIKNWSTCPWSIATTYINTEGYVDKSSAKEIDIGGLLGILKNNKNCNKYVVIEEIKRARKARNELFHHVNFELKKDELNKCIDAFKEVLKNKGISNDNVEEALQLLEKVQENQIDINISEDTEQREQNFRQHAMTEEVDIRQKMLNTEMEKSKQKSKEVELLCDIRKGRNTIGEKEEFRSSSDDRTCTKHQGMKNEWYCQEENIFCCKRCKEEEHKSCIEPFEGAIKAKRKTLEMDACPSNLPGPDLSNTGNSLHDV